MVVPSDIVHVISNAVTPDTSISSGWSDETREHGNSRALASAVVTQKGCDVVLVNLQIQAFHRHFASRVHFLQVSDLHCRLPTLGSVRLIVRLGLTRLVTACG